jgi:hypothetical protein
MSKKPRCRRPLYAKVPKEYWQQLGGLENPACFRRGTRQGGWTYWIILTSS